MTDSDDLQPYIKEFKEFKDGENLKVSEEWELVADTTTANTANKVKVWRKKEGALYSYKMWGCLENLELEPFNEYFLDLKYRKVWDSYTTALDVVETKGDNSMIIVWLFKLPIPFTSPREYLFDRKVIKVDGIYVLKDLTVKHEKVPESKSNVRVETYNAVTLYATHPKGIQLYVNNLTALDLKLSLPKTFINWAASTGLKSYLDTLRDNYVKYAAYKKSENQK
eukprot:TRINITY_DN7769_c0_g1_i1.p1 TRINITY_DN7769_c0_g1~~TRINITY_DN7769_c0_g1_i1.p1  ORF type:complete len:224 (-),score=47.13 TRINITY_DN7769_c0_g1_i1:60-731(-)